jgi:HEAT repeat protein
MRNTRFLASRQWAVVCVAAVAAVGCGKSALPTQAGGKSIQHWVDALNDPLVKNREAAVTKLGNVGTADPAAIPALIGALKDKSPLVRRTAILALAKSGHAAQDAAGPLTDIQSHDQDAKVRELAAKGLKLLQGGAPPADNS